MAIRKMLLTLAVSIVLCVAAMVSPAPAEFTISTSGGLHERAKLALSSKSGFVVVWSYREDRDIMARRYDNKGAALSGEILVASSGDDERTPTVGVVDDGTFAVTWHNRTAGDNRALRYDTGGSPVGNVLTVGSVPIPNFGYETIFGSSQSSVEDTQIATQVVLAEAGTVGSITAYINDGNKFVRYAIYSDNNGQPDVRLAQTEKVKVRNGLGWQTIDLPDTALTAGTYWLALAFERSWQRYYHEATGGQTRTVSNNDVMGPGYTNPWGTSESSATRKISIYASMAQAETTNADPGIGMADDGSFVVSWTDESAWDIFAQRYDAAGNLVGGQISVSVSAAEDWASCVAVDGDGSFVVAWHDLTSMSVVAQRYDAGGNALGGQIQVASSTECREIPSIAMANDGSFVLAWDDRGAEDVFVQRYDAGGSALGATIQITSGSDDERAPGIGVADDGSFVVAWENRDAEDVFAQRYDTGGSALGGPIQVTTSSGRDRRPSVAVGPRGRFVVVWSNENTESILGQLYDKNGAAVVEWKTGWRVMKWVEITAP